MHPTRAGKSISDTISEAGVEAMKNDSEYEEWVLNDLQVGWSQPDKWSGICGGAFSTIYLNHPIRQCNIIYHFTGCKICNASTIKRNNIGMSH